MYQIHLSEPASGANIYHVQEKKHVHFSIDLQLANAIPIKVPSYN